MSASARPSAGIVLSHAPDGTVGRAHLLMSAMPICRHSIAPPARTPREQPIVRLSHYVVKRRSAPRAANDNRRSRLAPVWPWAMAAAAAPAVTAALILTRLI